MPDVAVTTVASWPRRPVDVRIVALRRPPVRERPGSAAFGAVVGGAIRTAGCRLVTVASVPPAVTGLALRATGSTRVTLAGIPTCAFGSWFALASRPVAVAGIRHGVLHRSCILKMHCKTTSAQLYESSVVNSREDLEAKKPIGEAICD